MRTILVFKTFIDNNYVLISVTISIISIVIALFGVHYGHKSYLVANQIFEKGIRVDRQKVLRQISLEFVIGFFIPLSELKDSLKKIRDKHFDEILVSTLRDVINTNLFSVQFPYFDIHKGDVWDSLTIFEERTQAEAFNAIVGFVEKARKLDKEIGNLSEILDDFLNKPPDGEKEWKKNPTLKMFFDDSKSISIYAYNRGMHMIDELAEYEKLLPKELKIREMKSKLLRYDE